MGREKIEEAYVEIKVDGLENVKKIIGQAKQTTQTFNSTLGDTQSWIDRISSQMAGLKSSVTGGISEPLNRLQRAAQQAKNLTAIMGTGAVPLSAKPADPVSSAPVAQTDTVRSNNLLDEAMGIFDPLAGVKEYRSEAKAKPQEREVTARQQAVAVVAELQKKEQERLDTIRELTALNQELIGTDDKAAAAVNRHIESLKNEQKAYEDASKPKPSFIQGILNNISAKTADFREKVGAVRNAVAGPTGGGIRGAMGGGLSGITQLVSRTIGPAMAAAGSAMAAVAAVAAPVAAAFAAVQTVLVALPAAFVGAAYAISKFTDAVNPGLTMQLNMVMRDLTAVIGTSLNPVLQTMVPIIREWADRMLPIAREVGAYFSEMMVYLEPVMKAFNALYQALVGALMPVFKLVGDAATIMAQSFGVVMEIVSASLAPVKVAFEAIYTFFSPLIEAIKVIGGLFLDMARNIRVLMDGLMNFVKSIAKAFGLDTLFDESKKGFKTIGEVLHKFANTMLLVAARIAKFFGMTSFVEGMINSLKPKENSMGLAAAQNPQYQSIEGLGKNMALQAAIATGGANTEESEQQKMDREMLVQLQAIKDGGTNIVDAINGLPGKIAEAIANGAKKTAGAAASVVKEAATAPFNLGYEGARYMSEAARSRDLDRKLAEVKARNAARFVQG